MPTGATAGRPPSDTGSREAGRSFSRGWNFRCQAHAGWVTRLLWGFMVLLGTLRPAPLPAAPAQPGVQAQKPYGKGLVVGSELDFPPFALVTQDRRAAGFTVDLWNAVAKEAGLESEVRTGPFHEILDGFRRGEVDVMINLAQSDERRKFCNFAVPHVTMYGAIFVRKGDSRIRSEADLPGKRLIVLNRDLPHDYAVSRGWTNGLVLVDDAATGLEMLGRGEQDAMLLGKLVGLNTLKQHQLSSVHPVGQPLQLSQKFAFAVLKERPGSAELLARINEGLALVKANGTYDTLYEQWFGILEPRSPIWDRFLKYLIPFLVVTAVVTALATAGYLLERRLRRQLKRSFSLLNATLESTVDGILAVDGQGNVVAHNPQFVQLLPGGILADDPSPAGSRKVFERIAAGLRDATGFRATLARMEAEPDAESFDTLSFTDGRSFEVVSKPQRGGGVGFGRVWSFRDVTRQEQASAQIRHFNAELEARVTARTRELKAASLQLERLSQVAARTSNSVVICDPGGRIEWVNKSFERLSGWNLEEVVGRSPADFLAGPGTDPEAVKETLAAMRDLRPARLTILNYGKTGNAFWVELDINPVLDKEGILVGFVSVLVDITERRAAEDALRQQSRKLTELNAHLEQALRSRDSFLAAMSHELRTPLHGILGLTEIILTGPGTPLDERRRNYLRRIEECGNHLLELINDVLDLAKVQSVSLTLDKEECDVGALCHSALQVIAGTAERKGIRIEAPEVPSDLRLHADARRVRQVLVNLLGNAVKFTGPGGRIGLDVQCIDGQVAFEIWDTGIGIEPQNLPRLFQPFVQLDDSLSRLHSGTGLGLALVRQIVDAHGGGIEVSSTPGMGSHFRVALPGATHAALGTAPMIPTHPTAPPTSAEVKLRGTRVLVAEDNAVNLLIIKSHLESAGADVVVAESGAEAVRAVGTSNPSIIIMDIQMPHMDGLEATSRIRRLPLPAAGSVPIIAMTALAMPGDRERCFAAGCNAYLSKPVRLGDMTRLMGELLGVAG